MAKSTINGPFSIVMSVDQADRRVSTTTAALQQPRVTTPRALGHLALPAIISRTLRWGRSAGHEISLLVSRPESYLLPDGEIHDGLLQKVTLPMKKITGEIFTIQQNWTRFSIYSWMKLLMKSRIITSWWFFRQVDSPTANQATSK